MQLIHTQRQGRDKEYIGTWKLLQALYKELLCNYSPVLAYPDPNKPYIIDTDASNLAIGAVL